MLNVKLYLEKGKHGLYNTIKIVDLITILMLKPETIYFELDFSLG